MSAAMEKHVRIRIFFENASKTPTWLLVDHESMYSIGDLEKEISRRYFGNSIPLILSLRGCVLPTTERTVILRDNDRVDVSEIDCTERKYDTVTRHSERKKQKKKKKAEKRSEEEEEQTISAAADNHTGNKSGKKKKRKKEKDSESEGENDYKVRKHTSSNTAATNDTVSPAKLPRSEALIAETEGSVTEAVSSKTQSCVSAGGVEIAEEGASHQDSKDGSAGGQKRKRKRKRKNKGNISVDNSFKSQSNVVYSRHQQTLRSKPSKHSINIYSSNTNHKMFNSDESETEGDAATPSGDVTEHDAGPRSGDVTKGRSDAPLDTVSEDNMEPLQLAKQKLLAKIDQEYNMKDNTDIGSVSDQRHSEHVQKNRGPLQGHRNGEMESEDKGDNERSTTTLQSSVSANGVPVYRRSRQQRYHNYSYGKELTKEQQLNTRLSNKSVILTNNPSADKQEDAIDNEEDPPVQETGHSEEDIPPPPAQDYTKFPVMQGTPRTGDKIAYKILELSDSYTPEVSDYKEAVVLSFQHDSQIVEIDTENQDSAADPRPFGKFHLTEDESATAETKQTLPWASLLDPRLLA